MFNWKFVLYVAFILNTFWIICARNITPGEDIEGHHRAQLNVTEELYAQSNGERILQASEYYDDQEDLRSVQNISKSTADVPLFDVRADLPSNCAEATALTRRSGYYLIKFSALGNDIALVECDAQTDGGDWTVIQRRQYGSTDFYLNWSQYKVGFGDIETDYFMGLDKLYALTNFDGPQELLILMQTKKLLSAHAKYDAFSIGNESEKYVLKKLGKYSGTAGDSLRAHVGCKFSTKDQDNDNSVSTHCAQYYHGAWWYDKCYKSHLNGIYGVVDGHGQGIMWNSLNSIKNPLIDVKMMIRRRRY